MHKKKKQAWCKPSATGVLEICSENYMCDSKAASMKNARVSVILCMGAAAEPRLSPPPGCEGGVVGRG